MSINGIPGNVPGLGGLTGPREAARPGVGIRDHTETQARAVGSGGSPAGAAARLGVPRTPASLPAEPPPGTDPELWSVLSAEERVFFARVGAMGPLTYGRLSGELGAQPSVVRGGRIDLKA